MKKKISIILLAAIPVLSCSNGPKPENVAEEFLNAYLSTDYEKAASLCTPSLNKDLLKALEERDALDEKIKENIKRHTQHYKPQINTTSLNKNRDTAVVEYSVINIPATAASSDCSIESRLSLVKEKDGWKINALN